MARIARPGVGATRQGAVHVPGIYRRLLAQERQRAATPDPRWRHSPAAQRGEVCPADWLQSSPWLADLEAGGPVELPIWALGGHREPDERFRRLTREDRSIRSWTVHSDDMVVPFRRAGR
jgi:hypothetical protein